MSISTPPRPRYPAARLPADLAAALGVTTQGELWDMLETIVSEVIADEVNAGTTGGIPVRLVGPAARKPRLADG